jgi:hypothetical protein
MPHRKPAGWPRYMRSKRLKNGLTGYFWDPPTWARKRKCPVRAEALGTDYATAKERCDEVLNRQFDAWRTGGEAGQPSAVPGTFNWMVSIYKGHPKYKDKPPRTRKSIDAALALVAKHMLKDGRPFGGLTLASITPGVADRLFAKLKEKPGGGARTRTAVLSMQYCRRAWNVARREKPEQVPLANPFAKMGISYAAERTRPVSHPELVRFVEAADKAGEPSIGTAAMIAFFWLQREIDILSRLTWNHYRPSEAPDCARIFHHKTGELVDLPLFDEDGTDLWPELTSRLDNTVRRGTLIVMRDRPDRRRKTFLPWNEHYFRHRVAEIREAAAIDQKAKFMGLRHGGNVEGAEAGLTDAQLRALSGHRTTAALLRSAQTTKQQRRAGARMRLEARTKKGNLSE